MEVGNVGAVRVAAEKKQAAVQPDEARKVLEAVENVANEGQMRPRAESSLSREEAREKLQRLAVEMNEMARPLQTRISFGFSEEAGMMYLNVIDGDTGSLIRQFPSKEAMEFAAKMREWVGMLLDKTI